MDGRSLTRARWRLRGAWMWPICIVLTIVDGFLLHTRPVVGDSATLVGSLILAFVINLIVIVVVGPTLGALVRKFCKDMPKLVSNNYAGAVGVILVTAVILAGGLIHHHVVTQDRAAEDDAVLVARDYIATHARHPHAYYLRTLSVFEIQPPARARVCAYDYAAHHWYCLMVTVPVGGGRVDGANYGDARVRYAGSESNQLLSQGVG